MDYTGIPVSSIYERYKAGDSVAELAQDFRLEIRVVGSAGLGGTHEESRLRYRRLEIAALRPSRARVSILTASNLRSREIAAVFLAALPRIHNILHLVAGPFVARISRSGQVKIT